MVCRGIGSTAVVLGLCLTCWGTAIAQQERGAGVGTASAEGNRPVRPSRVPAGTLSKVNEALLSRQYEIRQLRGKALADRKSQQERILALRAEKRLVSRSIDVLREELEKRQKDLTAQEEKLNQDKAAVERLKKPAESMIASMKKYLDAVDVRVDRGIPWQVSDRKRTIQQVRAILDEKDPSPAAGLAAVGRIQQEEEALGRLVESGSVQFQIGNEEVAVQAFHLGLLAVIFANEDATVIGFAQAGQTLEDGLDSAAGTPEAANGYLAAVDILRRRRTPSIIDLYLPTLSVMDTDAVPARNVKADEGGRP